MGEASSQKADDRLSTRFCVILRDNKASLMVTLTKSFRLKVTASTKYTTMQVDVSRLGSIRKEVSSAGQTSPCKLKFQSKINLRAHLKLVFY